MVYKPLRSVIGATSKGRFIYLLIALLLYTVLVPFLTKIIALRIFTDILLTAILLAGIYAARQRKRQFIIAIVLGIPLFMAVWADNFLKSTILTLIVTIGGSLFFAYMIIIFLSFLFRAKEVTAETIYAAIVVYLFMGVLWSFSYRLLFSIDPTCFQIALNQNRDPNLIFVYFSFVTLTTLGYGDIIPLSDQAYALTILEAVVGQMYLAIMIARLVGMQISQSMGKKGT
jgi:hypothetical protein